jgi:periplasmic protein TonB
MAYVSSQNSASRARTGIAVAAVQALGLYAIIASLSYVVNPPKPEIRTGGFSIPQPTITPTPTRSPETRDRTLPSPMPTHGPLASPSAGPAPQPTASPGTDEGPGTMATASPSHLPTTEPSRAAFTPKAPKPRGRPGEWVTRNDYPAQDLREGNEGTVHFRLGVGAEGRVTSCTVIGSSGFPRLDAAACAKLTQRGKFDPATDENGVKVAGTWYNAVRWSIEK